MPSEAIRSHSPWSWYGSSPDWRKGVHTLERKTQLDRRSVDVHRAAGVCIDDHLLRVVDASLISAEPDAGCAHEPGPASGVSNRPGQRECTDDNLDVDQLLSGQARHRGRTNVIYPRDHPAQLNSSRSISRCACCGHAGSGSTSTACCRLGARRPVRRLTSKGHEPALPQRVTFLRGRINHDVCAAPPAAGDRQVKARPAVPGPADSATAQDVDRLGSRIPDRRGGKAPCHRAAPDQPTGDQILIAMTCDASEKQDRTSGR